jgi:hypothetical protein
MDEPEGLSALEQPPVREKFQQRRPPDSGQQVADMADGVTPGQSQAEQVGKVAPVVERIRLNAVVSFLPKDVPKGILEVRLVRNRRAMDPGEGGAGAERVLYRDLDTATELARQAPRDAHKGVEVRVHGSKREEPKQGVSLQERSGHAPPACCRCAEDSVVDEPKRQVVRKGRHTLQDEGNTRVGSTFLLQRGAAAQPNRAFRPFTAQRCAATQPNRAFGPFTAHRCAATQPNRAFGPLVARPRRRRLPRLEPISRRADAMSESAVSVDRSA